MISIPKLTTPTRMHPKRIRTRPPPNPRNQIPLPEVHQPNFRIRLLAREAHRLQRDQASGIDPLTLPRDDALARAVGIEGGGLEQVSADQIDDGGGALDEVGE